MFLLLDLETTGFDFESRAIIEVAARVMIDTNKSLGDYHSLVSPPHSCQWNPVAREMHEKSGLVAELESCSKTIDVVDQELMTWASELVGKWPLYLMGNGVHFDRRFIYRHMPQTHDLLHYRQLDVTSVWLWHEFMGHPRQKIVNPAHRAVDDIDVSLEQAREMWLDKSGRRRVSYKNNCRYKDLKYGFFCQWSQEHEEYQDGPGHFPVAIIENDDGTIETAPARLVRFLS